MTQPNQHLRALELMIDSLSRRSQVSSNDCAWLESHLADCPECASQESSIKMAISEMRSIPVMANPTLVHATQLRVRARAQELRRQEENMRPLWLACAFAFAWAVLALPFLWQGFAWLGHANRVPDFVWQTGFLAIALLPIAAVGTIGLASRYHRAATQ